jgi:hypothetical protein
MASVTLEQKKLEQLKQQLFGKADSTYKVTGKQFKESMKAPHATSQVATLESVDLKSDLLKIGLLSILALGIQLSLFLANQHGLIKLFN